MGFAIGYPIGMLVHVHSLSDILEIGCRRSKLETGCPTSHLFVYYYLFIKVKSSIKEYLMNSHIDNQFKYHYPFKERSLTGDFLERFR